jgi:hypothetical protein
MTTAREKGAREKGALIEPIVVGSLAGLGLLAVNPPDTGIPWCPSALFFDVACPLCGLTRGIARLVRGDLAASLGFHPMAWVVLAVAVGSWIVWMGRRAGWWTWRSPRVERWTITAVGLGLIATWGIRAMQGTLPPI